MGTKQFHCDDMIMRIKILEISFYSTADTVCMVITMITDISSIVCTH